MYQKSREARSPSRWYSDSFPYQVEFYNYVKGPHPNVADTTSHFYGDGMKSLGLQDLRKMSEMYG